MSALKIKKDDVVIVISGADKGKKGRVLKVDASSSKLLVEGVRMQKKCLKRTEQTPEGGIIDRESPLHISNVALYCEQCSKGVKAKIEKSDNKRIRKCVSCGHAFDA